MKLYTLTAERIDGHVQPLSDYEGNVLLIVNTASRCGYTPQYKDLQALYEEFRDEGLEVLGFPCNQFAEQEPGSNEEIAQFCQSNYAVTFPLFAKIDVNGAHTHPVYRYLKGTAKNEDGTEDIPWNFTKFLIDRKGNAIKRYAPGTKPAELAQDIKAALEA